MASPEMMARLAARLEPRKRVSFSKMSASWRSTTKNENIMNSKISGNMAKASLTLRLTRLSVERCPLIGGRFVEWERASWDRKKAA